MGDRFENQRAAALTKLVRDYPLSSHLENAKEQLTAMKRPVPEADPSAYAHMKYEMANRGRPGMVHRVLGPFESHPDVYMAAKSGAPAMESIRPSVPVSVPQAAAGGQTGISDVGVGVVSNTNAIDTQPDARLNIQPAPLGSAPPAVETPALNSAPANALQGGTDEQKASVGANGQKATPATPAAALAAASTTPATPAPEVLPTNHPATKDQIKAYKKQQEKAAKLAKKNADAAKPAASSTPAVTTPPATPQPTAPQ